MSDLAELLVDYVSGELSGEERARVDARLVADPAFRARAEPLLAAWGARVSVAEGDAEAIAGLRQAIVVEGRTPVRRMVMGVAAAAVLVMGGVYGTGMYRIVAPVVAAHQDVRVSTGVGELRSVLLPDGSRVTLGPESRVRYRASFFRDVPELTVVGQVSVDVHAPLSVRVAAHDSAVVWTVVAGTTVDVIDSTVVFRPPR